MSLPLCYFAYFFFWFCLQIVLTVSSVAVLLLLPFVLIAIFFLTDTLWPSQFIRTFFWSWLFCSLLVHKWICIKTVFVYYWFLFLASYQAQIGCLKTSNTLQRLFSCYSVESKWTKIGRCDYRWLLRKRERERGRLKNRKKKNLITLSLSARFHWLATLWPVIRRQHCMCFHICQWK